MCEVMYRAGICDLPIALFTVRVLDIIFWAAIRQKKLRVEGNMMGHVFYSNQRFKMFLCSFFRLKFIPPKFQKERQKSTPLEAKKRYIILPQLGVVVYYVGRSLIDDLLVLYLSLKKVLIA